MQGWISTKLDLMNRGNLIESSMCGACIEVECIAHILVGCPFVGEVQSMALKWCGLDNIMI